MTTSNIFMFLLWLLILLQLCPYGVGDAQQNPDSNTDTITNTTLSNVPSSVSSSLASSSQPQQAFSLHPTHAWKNVVICRDYVHDQGDLCNKEKRVELMEVAEAQAKCCMYGGGQRIEDDDPYLLALSKHTDLSEFYIPGSAAQRALFFLSKDDFDNGKDHEDSLSKKEDFEDENEQKPSHHAVRLNPKSSLLEQRYALVKFYFEMGGAERWRSCWRGKRIDQNGNVTTSQNECNHRLFNGTEWLSPVQECNWAFVSCNRDHHVTHIIMVDNIFQLPITSYVPTVKSLQIPPELSKLKSLVHLDLRSNNIEGTLPTNFGDMRLLRYINLNDNSITGMVPTQLYKMYGMEYLNLGNNLLTGSISTYIGGLINLRAIHLGYNYFSGTIPSELAMSTLLGAIHLAGNTLSGSIPTSLCSQRGKYEMFDLEVLKADCSLCNSDVNDEGYCCCTSCVEHSSKEWDDQACPNVQYSNSACTNYFNSNDNVHWYASTIQDVEYANLFGVETDNTTTIYENFDGYYYTDDELLYFLNLETSYPDPSTYIGCDDIDLYGCGSYSSFVGLDSYPASDACCSCQGYSEDLSSTVTSKNTVLSTDSLCKDFQIAYPWPQYNCDWFSQNITRCDSYGNENVTLNGNKVVLAKDACCVCGGGVDLATCNDLPEWRDNHFSATYTCDDYDDNHMCEIGEDYKRFNAGPKHACCICGGGFSNASTVLVEPGKKECYSDYNWQALTAVRINGSSTYMACDDFLNVDSLPDIDQCLAYGNLVGSNSYNASTSCCECKYGEKASRGGFRGDLIGKMLRVGLTSWSNLDYVYSVNSSGHSKGSIHDFLQIVAENNGFGLLQYHNSIDANTFSQCFDDMFLGEVDICLGTFANETLPPNIVLLKTDTLYDEKLILVVREMVPTFSSEILVPFRAFAPSTWILVVGVLSMFGILLNVIHGGCCGMYTKNWLNRIGSIIFNTINNFASGSVVNTSENPDSAEKCVGIGFAMFLFFVLVAYGASNTASFVTGGVSPQFSSLHDISRSPGRIVCTRYGSRSLLVAMGYSPSLFDESIRSDFDKLNLLLLNNGTCDAVILSRESLEASSARNSALCKLYPLFDTTILDLQVVLPLSDNLDGLGESLVTRFNRLLNTGLYDQIHNKSKNESLENLPRCDFTIPTASLTLNPVSFFYPAIFAGFTMILSICFIFVSRTSTSRTKTVPMSLGDAAPDEMFRLLSQSDCISSEELDRALSILPDCSLLEALTKRLDVEDSKLFIILDTMTTLELIYVAEKCVVDEGITKEDIDAAIRSLYPRDALKDLIMHHSEARIRAMDFALAHRRQDEDYSKISSNELLANQSLPLISQATTGENNKQSSPIITYDDVGISATENYDEFE